MARQPALGGERLQLAADALALHHRVGDGVEQHGQVSADLALDLIAMTVHARSRLSMRSAASPSASSIERPRRTSVNTRCSSLRIGSADLLRDRLEALHEREPGAQRAREQRERVGQLALERVLPVALRVFESTRTDRAPTTTAAISPTIGPTSTANSRKHEDREGGHVEQQLGRADRQVGLLEHQLGRGRATRALARSATVKSTRLLHDRRLGLALMPPTAGRRFGRLVAGELALDRRLAPSEQHRDATTNSRPHRDEQRDQYAARAAPDERTRR